MSIRCPKCGTEHRNKRNAKLKYVHDSPTEQHVESCVSCRTTVTCSKCRTEVEKTEAGDVFDRRIDSPTGFQYECKMCRLEQSRKYRASAKKKKKVKKKPATKQKRTEKAYHREYDKNRDRKKEFRDRTIRSISEKLPNDELIGETARTMNHAFRMIIERQMNLFYGKDIHSFSGIQKKNQIISETLFEIREALSRANVRMKRVIQIEPTSPLDGLVETDQIERSKALGVLGLPRTATPEEIKKRYRELAKSEHPDHGGSSERMAELNNAWSTLEAS